MREELKGRNLSFTEIAKLVGENWQNLNAAEKEPYESQAQSIKEKFLRDLAEYKKTPDYKKYMAYLQDFKAKHSSPSHGMCPQIGSIVPTPSKSSPPNTWSQRRRFRNGSRCPTPATTAAQARVRLPTDLAEAAAAPKAGEGVNRQLDDNKGWARRFLWRTLMAPRMRQYIRRSPPALSIIHLTARPYLTQTRKIFAQCRANRGARTGLKISGRNKRRCKCPFHPFPMYSTGKGSEVVCIPQTMSMVIDTRGIPCRAP